MPLGLHLQVKSWSPWLILHPLHFLGQIEENKECQKCSLLGTENCDTVNGKCVCKDGYFGSTCKRKLLLWLYGKH